MIRVVLFDGGVLGEGPATGVARSFLDTLEAFARSARERVVLALPRGVDAPSIPEVEAVVGGFGRGPGRLLALPRLARRLDADLLHCPVAAIPLRAPCPVVATIHDLPWMSPDRLHESGRGWRHRAAARVAALCAAAIIAPSTHTALDLRHWLGAEPRGRLRVVPHGVVAPAEIGTPGPNGPFLFLGDARPRKNLPRLRAAIARARQCDASLPELLAVGPGQPGGYVDEPRKAELLGSCTAVVLPSLHEGFGLPVLEAMAYGAPVLTSRASSLPEVGGTAALYVDASDVDDIAAGLLALHRDAELRARMRALGRVRAAAFPVAAVADAWRTLHDEVLA